ncbi:MAG: extracellular solute-binding protein [Patescibacteria group bacterium]
MIKKFKKLFTIFSGVSLLLLAGFGCKPPAQPVPPATLEYWTVSDDLAALQNMVGQFRAARPYFTINIRQFRADEIYASLLDALAEDRGPDIISVDVKDISKYLSKLTPMPSGVKDTLVQITQGQMSDTVNVINNDHALLTMDQLGREYVQTVAKDAVRDGKIYGLPLSLDVMALYYNQDLLDRAGIAEPPKNWQDFSADVKILSKFDKTSGRIIQAGAALGTGYNIPGSSDLLYILFTQSKLPFTNSGQALFNIPPRNTPSGAETPAGRVMNFYTDFANPARDTYTWNEQMPNALDSFVNGQVAFFFGMNRDLPIIKARAPSLNFDILPMLQLVEDSPVNVADYSLQSVLLKSKHSNEAWSLIDYLAHSSANKLYLQSSGRPTALRSNIADQNKLPELAPFASQLLTAENWYRGRDFVAADKAIQDMSHDWLLSGTAADILKAHSEILNRGANRVNQTF